MKTSSVTTHCQVSAFRGFILAVLMTWSWASSASAGIEVSIEPVSSLVNGGAVFDVEIIVAAGSDDFNGFDLEIGYDPAMVTYVGRPLSELPGPLMEGACANSPFHLFQTAPDSTHLSVSYIMLCAGASVSGPGTVYTLRFQAKYQSGITELQFLDGTDFYNAGIKVTPLTRVTASVLIDYEAAVGDFPLHSGPNLRAAPNPFNPSTRLFFELPEPGKVNVTVFDARGRHIQTLVEGWSARGEFGVTWNGTDDRGRSQAGGVYLFVLEYSVDGRIAKATQKVVLVP